MVQTLEVYTLTYAPGTVFAENGIYEVTCNGEACIIQVELPQVGKKIGYLRFWFLTKGHKERRSTGKIFPVDNTIKFVEGGFLQLDEGPIRGQPPENALDILLHAAQQSALHGGATKEVEI